MTKVSKETATDTKAMLDGLTAHPEIQLPVAALETLDQTPPAIEAQETMTLDAIMEAGFLDAKASKNSAIRSLIWFGFGYHLALQDGAKKAAQFIAEMRGILEDQGDLKGNRSTKGAQAMAVGNNFKAIFAKELNASYTGGDKMRVDAMLAHCLNPIVGAKSVARLVDLAKHGDADHTFRIEREKVEAKKAETQEADEKAKAKRQAMLDAIENGTPRGFDNVVYAIETQTPEIAQATGNVMLDAMTDDAIKILMDQCAAELAKRAAITIATDTRFADVA